MSIVNFEADQAPQRIYAIGDIHGRLDLLQRMIELIEHDMQSFGREGALVVGLGDYVDRGPNSRGVLELLSSKPFSAPFIALAGNHEEMLGDFLRDHKVSTGWTRLGGIDTLRSYGVPTNQVMLGKGYAAASEMLNWLMPEEHTGFLKSLKWAVKTPEYYFCHAGVRPSVPLDQQEPADLFWIREEFLNSAADYGRVVVHGHTVVPQVDVRPNRINVDTGAYQSGRLSCLVVEGGDAYILAATSA